jgi:hypothetical protein
VLTLNKWANADWKITNKQITEWQQNNSNKEIIIKSKWTNDNWMITKNECTKTKWIITISELMNA